MKISQTIPISSKIAKLFLLVAAFGGGNATILPFSMKLDYPNVKRFMSTMHLMKQAS